MAKRDGQAPAELAKIAGDWTHDAPGTKHRVDLKELPPPYATGSSVNGPKLVRRPDDAKLQVPRGFKIEEYATGLQNPRFLPPPPTVTRSSPKPGRTKSSSCAARTVTTHPG